MISPVEFTIGYAGSNPIGVAAFKIDKRAGNSRALYGLFTSRIGQAFLRGLTGLFRATLHRQRGLILGLGLAWLAFPIINPCEVNMRPGQDHGIGSRGMLSRG